MKWTSWTFLAVVGSLLFLVLFMKDWNIKAGVERLEMLKSHHSVLEDNADLKVVSERSPYMRNER